MIRRLRWKIVAINMAMVTAVMLAVFVGVLVSSRAAVERTVNQRLMQVVQTGRYDASLPGEGSAAPTSRHIFTTARRVASSWAASVKAMRVYSGPSARRYRR